MGWGGGGLDGAVASAVPAHVEDPDPGIFWTRPGPNINPSNNDSDTNFPTRAENPNILLRDADPDMDMTRPKMWIRIRKGTNT